MPAPEQLGPRDVVTVAGPDAFSYLQSQVSQELRDVGVGEQRWTLLLAPNGRVEVLARVRRTGDDVFELDTDAGFGQVLLDRLNRFKIRVKADTSLTEAEPAAGEPDAAVEAARIAAGWPRMGAEIVPGDSIPAETGLSGIAVSFTKGCYPGQELVERMDSRAATAPRSLRRVTVAEGTRPGDPVAGPTGDQVGTVTSVSGTTALAYVKRTADIGTPITH